jgi:hypothetical protein
MKNFTLKSITLFFSIIFLSFAAASAQKLTAEEVIGKHLDAIGAKDKRAAIKNQFILSDLQFQLKGSALVATGKAVLLSEGNKNLWGFNLNSIDYPQDRFGFDGKDTKVAYTKPGVRSPIGGFIVSYNELLKEGLLGGTLLSSWPLLDTDSRKAKISYEGTKKIDNRDAHVLSYMPKSGTELTIKMYFDAQNFRHLRTEYSRFIAARQGPTIDSSAGQRSDIYQVTENFSDFQKINGITLPKTYKLFYSYTGGASRNSEMEWTFNVTNFSVNQQLDQNSFDINAK